MDFDTASLYTRRKSFAGTSLPAETKALPMDQPTDGPRDGRTLLSSRGSRLEMMDIADLKVHFGMGQVK